MVAVVVVARAISRCSPPLLPLLRCRRLRCCCFPSPPYNTISSLHLLSINNNILIITLPFPGLHLHIFFLLHALLLSPSPSRIPHSPLVLFDSPRNKIRIRKSMTSAQAATDATSPKFISLQNKHNAKDNSAAAGYQFRLVSYNVLAQVYVKSENFPHSPSACLKWKARSPAILTELKNFTADFLCIQELDEYNNFYKKNMENFGYSSLYIQRTGGKRDGCGIFYNPRSVELVLKEEIHYNDLIDICGFNNFANNDLSDIWTSQNSSKKESHEKANNLEHGDPNDPRVRFKRDCVGLLAAFKLNNPSNHLVIVANTHIYWDPDWIDVKLAQAKYLLTRLLEFKELVSSKFNCKLSVIIAGDFNSTPGDKVYKYLVSANSESLEEAPIKLHSLYAANGGEPQFTNCTPGFTGTLDYIFLSDSGYLKPVSLLDVPGQDSSDVEGGLPNYHHPSDHLPIGGDFQVVST